MKNKKIKQFTYFYFFLKVFIAKIIIKNNILNGNEHIFSITRN